MLCCEKIEKADHNSRKQDRNQTMCAQSGRSGTSHSGKASNVKGEKSQEAEGAYA
jgi:hypothetical protein